MTFQEEILAGIPAELPEVKPYDTEINHALVGVVVGILRTGVYSQLRQVF